MIKGHLEIQLTDERTGYKQIIQQDNMVTNALIKNLGILAHIDSHLSSSHMSDLLPVATRGLGGIFLFDGALEENADNIHFPMNVHLMGHAGQNQNTQSPLAGSLNVAESKKTDTGYVNVWDFSTSQANGTIASLALTNYFCGQRPFDGLTDLADSVDGHYELTVAFDSENDIEYAYDYSSGKIYRLKRYSSIIRVKTPSYGGKEEFLDLGLSDPSPSNWCVTPGYDGYLYAIYFQTRGTAGDLNVKIHKYRTSDFSFHDEGIQSITIPNVTSYYSSIDYRKNVRCCVSHGYFYFESNDQRTLYKVNLSNTADVTALTFDSYSIRYVFPRYSGGLLAEFTKTGTNSSGGFTTNFYFGVIYPDGKYRLDVSNAAVSSGDPDMIYQFSYETDDLLRFAYFSIGISRDYLGTICNLSTPVTKTSAQSMKITYTLTNA